MNNCIVFLEYSPMVLQDIHVLPISQLNVKRLVSFRPVDSSIVHTSHQCYSVLVDAQL